MKRFLTYYLTMFSLLFVICMSMTFTAHATTKETQASTQETASTDTSQEAPDDESSSAPTPEKISLRSAKITLKKTTFTYTGDKIVPVIKSVKVNDKTLKEKKDYTVSLSNNTNKGTATLTIKPVKGSVYTDSASVTFTIQARSIKKTTVSSIAKQTYAGKAMTPSVKVTDGSKTLVKNKDYTLTYKKNNAVGTATVIIKGTGNYKESITKNFTILPSKVQQLTASKTTDSSVALKWKTVSGVKKYEVYLYSSAKKAWTKSVTVSKNTYTFTKLTAGTTYKFKVRALKTTSDKKTLYGSYSAVCTTATTPKAVTLHSVTPVSTTAVTLKWSKLKNCSGYEIQYSTNAKFKSAVQTKKVSNKSNTAKITGLTQGKVYYFRVRAYKTSNKKDYFGSFSAKKNSKVPTVYATYTTEYDASNTNRTTNLKLACKSLNGVVLAPGEQLNFDKVLGPRTAENGYKEAHVFSSGQVVNELGGGICQVASTIFNTALLANFQINERYQHSKQVTYVPLGRDAAIYSGVKNLRFTNNSNYTIQIKATVSGGKLTIQFLTDTYAKPAKVTLKVTKSNGRYVLQRYVNGKVNYTTSSSY